MDYEKLYKEALRKAKTIYQGSYKPDIAATIAEILQNVFTEIKESEDERIRKAILNYFTKCWGNCKDDVCGIHVEDVIAWLEKQGDKPQGKTALEAIKEKPVDNANKVEPKFHEGEWIAREGLNTAKIISIEGDRYEVEFIDGNKDFTHIDYIDRIFHLWTIKDAKDGDVLVHNGVTFIFMGIKNGIVQALEENFLEGTNPICFGESDRDEYHPATKEQRDALMKAMADAGWTFDFEKKELKEPKKIESNDEPNFKVGDWVIFNDNHESIYQIEKIENFQYTLRHILGGSMRSSFSSKNMIRHWTIQDVKDGDILSNGNMILIFKYFEEPAYRENIVAYIGLDSIGNIQVTDGTWKLGIDKAHPATKEQRDLLFKRMKEAGYEWDANKKEPKKIYPKFNVNDWV